MATDAINVAAEKASLRPKKDRSASLQMLGKSPSNRSTPANTETTKIHATSNAGNPSNLRKASNVTFKPETSDSRADKDVIPPRVPVNDDPKQPNQESKDSGGGEQTNTATDTKSTHEKTDSSSSSTWRGWFARDGLQGIPPAVPSPTVTTTNAPTLTEQIRSDQTVSASETPKSQTENQPQQLILPHDTKKSWLPIWGNETVRRSSSAPPDGRQSATDDKIISSGVDRVAEDATKLGTASAIESATMGEAPPTSAADGRKTSGWVFWSRTPASDSTDHSQPVVKEGEIAVADTTSQQRPRRTSLAVPPDHAKSQPEPRLRTDAQERPSSSASSTKSKNASTTTPAKVAENSSTIPTTEAKKLTPKTTAIAKPPEQVSSAELLKTIGRKRMNNLLLPSFGETFVAQQSPSFLDHLRRLLYLVPSNEVKHLSLIRDPPKIKNALAIGVHGYFPAPLVRTLIGQPTGTSIKFADMAAKSVQKWAKDHGHDCHVKTAALEGEGKILDRVELLWKLLLNWIDEIRKADFIMVACHSQGVPVAIMLVAKLIQFGCINNARVGLCAMAGVSTGPFADYKSRWISGSAGELFEFSDPTSRVSSDYVAALETVLKFGVRVSFIGSIDDQLVSLESSLFSPISHPHIYRAVLIDSRVHAPNFLSHLVGFALKLRNLGVPDHGLIRELSPPLAGSLYSGDGHSRLYEDESVYDLAVRFALETSSLTNTMLTQRPATPGVSNPYILPFAMRGILEEEVVKNDLQSEASELLKEFDDWRPTTKVLKDVKFRLEGIRSRL